MRSSMIWSALALSILAGCSGSDTSQDQASSDSEDAVSTTFIRGSWVANDPSLGDAAAIDVRPDHKFFQDSTKILNGVLVNGSPQGLVRQTGTWSLSTKNKTLTLNYDHGWDSPDPYTVVFAYSYTAAPILNGVYIPGHGPEAKLALTEQPAKGSHVAYPTQKFLHADSWCTSNADCKTELEDGTSQEGLASCGKFVTNSCEAESAN
jgi:hypothetical protein